MKQVRRNDTKINQGALSQEVSVPGVLMKSLCWKNVFIMHSPLVAQNCNKHLPFLLTSGTPCCPITPFQVALSIPTCALKSPKRTRDSDEVAFPNATSTSSRKASYCDSMLGAYTCKIHRDRSCSLRFRRQTLPPSGTQSTTHSSMLGLTSKPTPAWAGIPASTPE